MTLPAWRLHLQCYVTVESRHLKLCLQCIAASSMIQHTMKDSKESCNPTCS